MFRKKISEIIKLSNYEYNIINLWKAYCRHNIFFDQSIQVFSNDFFIFRARQIKEECVDYEGVIYLQDYLQKKIDCSELIFIKQIKDLNLSTCVENNVFTFAHRSTENVCQHAYGNGYLLYRIVDNKYLEFIVFDRGEGIVDLDKDNVPDILSAIKDGVSLSPRGSKGIGLGHSIRSTDNFKLYTNGFLWEKNQPRKLKYYDFDTKGVLIIARINI